MNSVNYYYECTLVFTKMSVTFTLLQQTFNLVETF